MKSVLIGLVSAALVVSVGCQGRGTSGGPGATNQTSHGKNPLGGQAEATFSLSPPTFATKLKQGEAKNVTIDIKRGTNFAEDVSVKFEGVPQGVTIEPADPMIKHGDDKTEVTVKAAKDAAVGDFTVKVIGHPTKGKDAAHDMKIKIDKK
jgi:hypothetical protein